MGEGSADRISQRVKHVTADLKRYAEKRFELLVVSAGEQYAHFIASSSLKFAGFAFFFGALAFLLVALALYLGSLLGSLSLGFVLVSLPLLAVGFLLINSKPRSLRRKIESEFEEELLAFLESDKERRERRKLLEPDSQKSLKNKEHNE